MIVHWSLVSVRTAYWRAVNFTWSWIPVLFILGLIWPYFTITSAWESLGSIPPKWISPGKGKQSRKNIITINMDHAIAWQESFMQNKTFGGGRACTSKARDDVLLNGISVAVCKLNHASQPYLHCSWDDWNLSVTIATLRGGKKKTAAIK